LRADFLGQALTHRPFAGVLQGADVKLGPMSRQDLVQAIANPAKRLGVTFEPGLVMRIVNDVGQELGNLADPKTRSVTIYALPENDNEYILHGQFGPDETLTSQLLPDLQIHVADRFTSEA
jgi:hypothetical protein